MASQKNSLDKLKKINEKAQATTKEKSFLNYLFDYLAEFNTSRFQNIRDALSQDKENFLHQAQELKKHILKEFASIYEKVKKTSEKHGLLVHHSLESYLKTNQTDSVKIDQIVDSKIFLERKIADLIQQKPSNISIFSKFANITCPLNSFSGNRIIVSLKINVDKWVTSKEKLQNNIECTVWYHGEKLDFINQIRNDAEKLHKEALESGDFFRAAKISKLHNELVEIFNPSKLTKSSLLNLKDLQDSFGKVHNHVIDTYSSDAKQKVIFENYRESIVIKFGTETVSYSTEDSTGNFVKAFCKDPRRRFSLAELWAIITGGSKADFGGKEKSQIKDTYKNVNKRLNKIGLAKAFCKAKGKDIYFFNPRYKT